MHITVTFEIKLIKQITSKANISMCIFASDTFCRWLCTIQMNHRYSRDSALKWRLPPCVWLVNGDIFESVAKCCQIDAEMYIEIFAWKIIDNLCAERILDLSPSYRNQYLKSWCDRIVNKMKCCLGRNKSVQIYVKMNGTGMMCVFIIWLRLDWTQGPIESFIAGLKKFFF